MPTVDERAQVLVIPPGSWDTGRADRRAFVRRLQPQAALLSGRMSVVSAGDGPPELCRRALAVQPPIIVVGPDRAVVYAIRVQACSSTGPNQARAAATYREVADLGIGDHLIDFSA